MLDYKLSATLELYLLFPLYGMTRPNCCIIIMMMIFFILSKHFGVKVLIFAQCFVKIIFFV